MASKIEVDEIFNAGGDNDTGIDLATNDVVKVKTANTERMRVDAGGDIGIGVSPETDHYGAYVNVNFGVSGLVGSNASGTNTTFLTNNAYLNTGPNWIYKETDEATKYNQSAGKHVWEGAASGSAGGTISFTERMTLDASGRLLIGTTSTLIDTEQVLQAKGSQACNLEATVASADGGSVLNLERSGNTQGDYIRLFNSSNAETGQIRVDSGGTTQFENVSDYRLKDNVKDWDVDASAKVKQVKIKTFDWKDQTAQTNGKGLVGVIAHELQEVYPHCVSGEKDGYGADVDKDGNKKPMYQGVDYGKLTPLLTKALQEALARIETLETKVKALESK